MPRVLEETMTAEELKDAAAMLAAADGTYPDLTDGGQVGGATLTPMINGMPSEKGRPAARRAYSWDGAESLLPLAWNPDGTIHDEARHYFNKYVCLCCKKCGIRAKQGHKPICQNCVKANCRQCKAGTDTKTPNKLGNGKMNKGWLIRNFYFRLEDVPFPTQVYGTVDCFQEGCVRRGVLGFKSEADMRLHATSRHRLEYRVHQDTLAAAKTDEVADLRATVNALMLRMAGGVPAPDGADAQLEEARARNREYMRKARAARKEAATIQQPQTKE